MSDFGYLRDEALPSLERNLGEIEAPGEMFLISKRFFDVVMGFLLLPLFGLFVIVILFLNSRYNAGSLFFVQRRMGQHCLPFRAIKFRTMHEVSEIKRSANCPLEVDRITPLGRFLRKSRIDELPQIINVLKGEMSFLGPRPDVFDHAEHFVSEIPGYRERHVVRPGISGYAQTTIGYVEGTEATRHKVNADMYYITNWSLRLETWVIWRTLAVILFRAGS